MKDLAVLCFCWKGINFRAEYNFQNVNTLASMVRRHLKRKHTFYCLTDDPESAKAALPKSIKIIKIDLQELNLGAQLGTWPGIFMFKPEIQEQIAEDLFLKIDLDCVITKSIDEIVFDKWPERIFGWLDVTHKIMNPSFAVFHKGFGRQVWDNFFSNRAKVDQLIAEGTADKFGWDQIWINMNIDERKKTFITEESGIFHRRDIERSGRLPQTARIVFFNSTWKPWHQKMKLYHPWIKEHYR